LTQPRHMQLSADAALQNAFFLRGKPNF
jgi:hypothetical protein